MGWTRNEWGDLEPTGTDLVDAVLGCLRQHGPLEVSQVAIELGTHLGRTRAAMSQMVAAGVLVDAGRGERLDARPGPTPRLWAVARQAA